jgi:hypothetical protein
VTVVKRLARFVVDRKEPVRDDGDYVDTLKSDREPKMLEQLNRTVVVETLVGRRAAVLEASPARPGGRS